LTAKTQDILPGREKQLRPGKGNEGLTLLACHKDITGKCGKLVWKLGPSSACRFAVGPGLAARHAGAAAKALAFPSAFWQRGKCCNHPSFKRGPLAERLLGPSEQPVSYLHLAAVILAVSIFALTTGLSYPLLTLVMDSRGYGADEIGLNSGMQALGMVVVTPLIGPLARRFGERGLAIGSLLFVGACLLLLKLFDQFYIWMALRLILGAASGCLWTISETWINAWSTNATRGRVIGIYASVASLGFGAGPLLLTVTGSQGWLPFLVALAALVPGFLVFVRLGSRRRDAGEGGRAALWHFARQAPVLIAAVAVFSLFEAVNMSLFPVYALGKGLSEGFANMALTVLIIGNVFLQPVVGWIADLFSRRLITIICALLVGVGAILLPSALGTLWFWPYMLIWGTAGFSLYTLNMAELGDRFQGAALLAGSATYSLVYGLAGIVGPPAAGKAMSLWGADALPYVFIVAGFALAAFRILRRPAGGGED
jgi:MFS family permease